MKDLEAQEKRYNRLLRKTDLAKLGSSLFVRKKNVKSEQIGKHRKAILLPLLEKYDITATDYIPSMKKEKAVVTYYMHLQAIAIEEALENLQE